MEAAQWAKWHGGYFDIREDFKLNCSMQYIFKNSSILTLSFPDGMMAWVSSLAGPPSYVDVDVVIFSILKDKM